MFDQNCRVIYPNDEGGVSIIVPAAGVTEEQVLKAVPKGKAFQIVDVEDIPTDRLFRDAWTFE